MINKINQNYKAPSLFLQKKTPYFLNNLKTKINNKLIPKNYQKLTRPSSKYKSEMKIILKRMFI
jgi:hypothetical protein